MNLSYWEQTSFFDKIDIAVIGSGIVGLNAAIHLKEMYPKLRVVIFEKGIIPSGASTRNAGFACFGSITELVDDLETIGLDALLKLVEKRWKGLQKLRQRVGDKHLDYKNWGGYELFSDKKIYEKHCEQMDFFNQALAPIIGNDSVFQVASNQIPTFGFHEVNDLIFNNSEGQINTGKMMQALLKIAKNLDISIFNGISIKNIHTETKGITLETAQNWTIQTKKVIVATNGFSKKLLPKFEFNLKDILTNVKNITVLQAIAATTELQRQGLIEVIVDKTSFKSGKFAKIYYRVCLNKFDLSSSSSNVK